MGAIVSCIILLLIALGVPMLDDSRCVASKDGEIFYSGPAYRISCSSAGEATKCTIGHAGFFHWIPKSHLLGKNIVVKCE